MTLRDVLKLKSCKNGDELFEIVTEILGRVGVATIDSDGNVKNLHMLCCEVAEVLNKEK